MSRLQTLPIIVATLIITLLVSNLVHPLFAASAAGPGYANVVAAAFQPESPSYDFDYDVHMQVGLKSGTGYFAAPLNVPQGAILNQMTIFGWDGDPATGFTVTLFRASGGEGTTEQIAIRDSAGANGPFEFSTATDPALSVVDNEQYGYFVLLHIGAPTGNTKDVFLSRVRVGYSFSQNLPVVAS